MKSSHEVGVYQAVIRVAILLLVTIDIAVSTMMPVLSRLNAEDVRKWTAMGRLLHKTLMFVALTIFSVMFSFAEQIIDVIYGVGRFTEGVPILRLFAFVVVLRYTAETYGLMLTTSGKQFPRMMVVLGATVLNLLLNLYAIPQYGIEGAAVVAILTNIVILAGYAIATRRFFSGWEASPRIIIVLAVMSALVTSLWFVRTMPVWYWGPGAIALSCAVLYYVGFTKEERYLLFRAKSNSSISST